MRDSRAEKIIKSEVPDIVFFESWGGSFVVARLATASYGCTCTQPLDKIDGYDLLKQSGRQLQWSVLEDQNPLVTVVALDCGMWTTTTNMNPT